MITGTQCPLCGGENECGAARGKGVCWCFSTPIPPDVIARVPEDAQGRSCVCHRCAAAEKERAGGGAPAAQPGG